MEQRVVPTIPYAAQSAVRYIVSFLSMWDVADGSPPDELALLYPGTSAKAPGDIFESHHWETEVVTLASNK